MNKDGTKDTKKFIEAIERAIEDVEEGKEVYSIPANIGFSEAFKKLEEKHTQVFTFVVLL